MLPPNGRKPAYGVRKGVVRTPRLAKCVDCPWSLEAQNAMGAAFNHAKFHGHRVHVQVRDVVVYQPNVGI